MHTEVIDRADKALPEKVVPDPIDENSRSERVSGLSQPMGKLQTTACFGRYLVAFGNGHGTEKPARDDFSERLKVAAPVDVAIGRGIDIANRQRLFGSGFWI